MAIATEKEWDSMTIIFVLGPGLLKCIISYKFWEKILTHPQQNPSTYSIGDSWLAKEYTLLAVRSILNGDTLELCIIIQRGLNEYGWNKHTIHNHAYIQYNLAN